jgi:hypothetical protein
MKRPLAIDQNGNQFDVPDNARVWRVSKQKASRRPFEPVYTPEGKPLDIPIDSDHEELPGHLDESGDNCCGRYKFVALDSQGQIVCPTAGFAILAGSDDDEPELRNAAPPHDVDRLATIASTLDALTSTIRELIEQSKQRDAETMKTLRQTIETLTVSNSQVSQTLARGYGDEVRPVRNPADETYYVEAPDPSATAEPPPSEDKIKQLLDALPQIVSMLDVIQKFRNANPAPVASNNGVHGSNGPTGSNGAAPSPGLGIHSNSGGNGTSGTNGGQE